MTSIQNLPGIVAAGELRSYNLMRGTSYTNLSNMDVQQGRAAITVPVTGRALHDYVPLYFGFKTPMVAWNQSKNYELTFFRFSLDILATPNVVITDGNARSAGTKFVKFTAVDDLAALDSKAIQTVKYAHDPEVKRRKQAEVLIPDRLQVAEIYDVICFSSETVAKAVKIFSDSGKKKSVYVNSGWYFTTPIKEPV